MDERSDAGRSGPRPPTRRQGLVVETLEDEVLVYDGSTHEAHCLNPTAARVWEWCDGRTPFEEMARRLSEAGEGLPAERAGALVELALAELESAGLLGDEGREAAPSRRDALRSLLRAAGIAAVLPAVDSITAPLAAQTATCITLADCQVQNPNPPVQCGGLPICSDRTLCCRRQGQQCQPRSC